MRYKLMFPEQFVRALSEHWPAFLPVGVLEYHSELRKLLQGEPS